LRSGSLNFAELDLVQAEDCDEIVEVFEFSPSFAELGLNLG
jgi:hypothetical protein